MSRLRAVLGPAIATIVVSGLLAALGTWQVGRLAWKRDLIARVETRMAAAPVALPPRGDLMGKADTEFDYLPVTVRGAVRTDRDVHVFAILGEPRGRHRGPGWWIVAPVTLADGTVIFANRGFVPDAAGQGAVSYPPLSGPVSFTGTLRGHDAGNLFTPADDPTRNRFYIRDPQSFAAALGLDPAAVYPVTVDMAADATPPGGLPQAGETQVTFPNSHLGYAITWYGLMLTCLGVGAVFIRRRWRAG